MKTIFTWVETLRQSNTLTTWEMMENKVRSFCRTNDIDMDYACQSISTILRKKIKQINMGTPTSIGEYKVGVGQIPLFESLIEVCRMIREKEFLNLKEEIMAAKLFQAPHLIF
tara:strand:+ start:46 stop:384 length:339 start_codon:yes stop_codon:yes gene_type:complete